ncbi:MAG: Antibiotic efflux pump outer membrane protein ArpC [Candidatus Marinimicrobia bacterium]|nr:Antibiotic efflux pump outer membrane protein ArpC [Candidatus Neomarinimicrobiota bacterium]
MNRILIFVGIMLIVGIVLGRAQSTQSEDVLALDKAIRIALENKVDVKIAKKRMTIAEAEKQSAWSNYLPSVSASAQGRRTKQGEGERFFNGIRFPTEAATTEDYSTGISVSQNIYAGGAVRNSNKLADLGLEIGEVKYNSAKEAVVLNVTSAYLDVLRTRELMKVYKKTLESSQAQVESVQERYNLGAVAKTDVLRAETRAGNDKINLLQQQNRFNQTKRNLNVAMGRSPMATIVLPEFNYEAPEGPASETAKKTALNNSTTLQELELNISQSRISLNMAKSNFLPDLGGYFSYNRSGFSPRDLYSDFSKNWSYTIGVELSIPIYNNSASMGMKTRPLIQRRQAELSIAQKNYTDAKLQIESQVENLIQQLETYAEIIELNRLNLQSAEEDLRLARERYNVGQATILDVLDAQANLTNAQQILVYAKFDAQNVEAQLQRAMGTLLDE